MCEKFEAVDHSLKSSVLVDLEASNDSVTSVFCNSATPAIPMGDIGPLGEWLGQTA